MFWQIIFFILVSQNKCQYFDTFEFYVGDDELTMDFLEHCLKNNEVRCGQCCDKCWSMKYSFEVFRGFKADKSYEQNKIIFVMC